MSDHVAVMSQGVIEQVSDGTTIYDSPETAFVASFVGENNHFSGKVTAIDQDFVIVDTPSGQLRGRNVKRAGVQQLSVGDEAMIFIRPESLRFIDGGSADNRLKATVERQEFEGNFWQVFLRVDGSPRIVSLSMVNDGHSVGHDVGTEVEIGCSAKLAVALPAGAMAAE